MNNSDSIFINNFQKGSKENANIGLANLVGIDTYSKKGVAKLSKKSVATTGFTGAPTGFETTSTGTYIWAQLSDGGVQYSADGGVTWQATNTAFPVAGHGNGIIQFQQFIFAFIDAKIYYWKDTAGAYGGNPTAGAWVDWTGSVGAITSLGASPITAPHCPLLYPNNRVVYFGNGGTIGSFGQVGTTAFNPAGVLNTDFTFNGNALVLPSLTYVVTNLSFLPPSSLAIGVYPYTAAPQYGELITWDTTSTNKFSPGLRLFSNATTAVGGITGGIKQLINRNQVLYAAMGGGHTIYETNGSTYNLLEDIGLYSNVRSASGDEVDYPVFFNSYPGAITVVGNKLLTGTATMNNTATYPPAGYGIFPVGVWSITFDSDGTNTTQCEYVLPLENTTVSPPSNGNYAKITALYSVGASASTGQILIGFSYNSSGTGAVNGIALVDLYKYIDNIAHTAIESELFEIGTALVPKTVNTIEINFSKRLGSGETFDVSYRTGLDRNWTVIQLFTGDGTQTSYHIDSNPIGATQMLQLRVRMATASGTAGTPELKTVKIN